MILYKYNRKTDIQLERFNKDTTDVFNGEKCIELNTDFLKEDIIDDGRNQK